MKVNPMLLNTAEFHEFLNFEVQIEVGERNFEDENKSEVHEIHQGKILKLGLTANYPYLPAHVIFQRNSGMVEEISLPRLLTIVKLSEMPKE
jgi:hypothetical protein